MKRKLAAVIVAAVAAVGLTGCTGFTEDSKGSQWNNDVPTTPGNRDSAEVGYMPDGFSNYATKCDRTGIRVYVPFHGDGAYGGVFAMADPTCT